MNSQSVACETWIETWTGIEPSQCVFANESTRTEMKPFIDAELFPRRPFVQIDLGDREWGYARHANLVRHLVHKLNKQRNPAHV